MYPLLAAGASALANNLVESVSGAIQRKLNPSTNVDFSAMMAKAGATAKPGAPAAPTLQEQIEALRAKLMQSPEVQTLLNSADPAKLGTLNLTPGGMVTYTGQDGRQSALTLSPESGSVARNLGALMSQGNPSATASMNLPLSAPVALRSIRG